ncbi:DUF1176 domain-containing protein [Vreelandella sp. EE22]
MVLRTLGWFAVATLSLSAGIASAQPEDTRPQVPDDVTAQISDTCAPVEAARGLAPQHYAIDDETGGDLWLVPCNVGAYQTSFEAIYQASESAPRKLLFAQWRNASWTGTDLLFDPTFDPDTGLLDDQYKDRGAGGCGGMRTWQWENGHFRLMTYRAAETCDDDASEFPVIFEAE